MRVPRIFVGQPPTVGSSLHLDSNASFHILKVLRMAVNRPLILFDGQGQEFTAELVGVNKKTAIVTVLSATKIDRESNLKIHLGQGISKGDRMDFTLQKAVELGVNAITPLWTERCDVKLKAERLEKKLNHWRGVIVSACEQSGRTVMPVLHPPQDLSHWSAVEADLKLVLHHRTSQPLSQFTAPNKIALTVGPEGGLTEQEITTLEGQHFNSVAFGPRILRTETAALAAVSVIQARWGDFG